jgi:RNA polymerase sigma-70 factor, ECF subfamily
VIYSVFTEGYAASAGIQLTDAILCDEAIRLCRLVDRLLPSHASILGLLALMLLHDARRQSRVSDAGDVVLLEDQNRSSWDQAKIAEGLELVDRSLKIPGQVNAYAVQAAIAALHARACDGTATDWRQILGLYEVLLRLQPTAVVELNHAVALSMVDGPARALDLIDSLAARGEFKQYHLLHAARGELLRKLGRFSEARQAYIRALLAATVEPERRFLTTRIATIDAEFPQSNF